MNFKYWISENILPPRKQCSAVAIQAVTNMMADDVKRTLPETVFEIEDRGYERDTSLTKIWRGKLVKDLRNGSDIILGIASVSETKEHEAHVMPIINGKLLNCSGWFNEPIATVITFRKII